MFFFLFSSMLCVCFESLINDMFLDVVLFSNLRVSESIPEEGPRTFNNVYLQ